jgi:hypothetical protein
VISDFSSARNSFEIGTETCSAELSEHSKERSINKVTVGMFVWEDWVGLINLSNYGLLRIDVFVRHEFLKKVIFFAN